MVDSVSAHEWPMTRRAPWSEADVELECLAEEYAAVIRRHFIDMRDNGEMAHLVMVEEKHGV